MQGGQLKGGRLMADDNDKSLRKPSANFSSTGCKLLLCLVLCYNIIIELTLKSTQKSLGKYELVAFCNF